MSTLLTIVIRPLTEGDPELPAQRLVCVSGVTKDEIVELFIHLEAYAGAARAFDSYQIALAVFGEHTSE